MNLEQKIASLNEFLRPNLTDTISGIEDDLVQKTRAELKLVSPSTSLFQAALAVKQLSLQIDTIVHALGILECLPIILKPDEKIETLSLGAGSNSSGFDLETDQRIAEFKFAHWRPGSANGTRKKTLFADYIKLLCEKDSPEKERFLFVLNKDKIEKFLNGWSSCEKALSRHQTLWDKLIRFLEDNQIAEAPSTMTVGMLHSKFGHRIQLKDIEKDLEIKIAL